MARANKILTEDNVNFLLKNFKIMSAQELARSLDVNTITLNGWVSTIKLIETN